VALGALILGEEPSRLVVSAPRAPHAPRCLHTSIPCQDQEATRAFRRHRCGEAAAKAAGRRDTLSRSWNIVPALDARLSSALL